ncbi:hypothetical protein RFF05_16095 [Bengtsoniella intestinalis]|uniref:hypothetical protein n=1 Tax=Bengtsoniella intestinalis TaxID=3073143 RepID=UPI00391F4943
MSHDIFVVRLLHCPQNRAARLLPTARIFYIKDISNFIVIPRGVNEGNAGCPTSHIAIHGIVPQPKFGTGRGIGSLGMDHQLFMERILVEPSHSGKQCRPVGETGCGLRGAHLIELGKFVFRWHGWPPCFTQNGTHPLR